MFVLNGNEVDLTNGLWVGEGDNAVFYPADALKLEATRDALGITVTDDNETTPPEVDLRTHIVVSNGDGTFSTALRNTDALRQEVKNKLESLRHLHKFGGVCVEGHWFSTEDEDMTRYLGLKDTARDMEEQGGIDTDVLSESDGQQSHEVYYKLMDNQYVPVTIGLIKKVVKAVKLLDMQSFAVKQMHVGEVMQAANPFDVDITVGWPQTYEEYVLAQQQAAQQASN